MLDANFRQIVRFAVGQGDKMNRPGDSHDPSEITDDSDPISGLYTTIPTFRMHTLAEAGGSVVQKLLSRSTESRRPILFTRLLPAAILATLILAVLTLLVSRYQLLGPEGAISFFTAGVILVLVILIWRSATTLRAAEADAWRTEERLERSRSHLEMALEAGEVAAWELDLTTQKIRRTSRYDKIFGYAVQRPTWTLSDFVNHLHPEDKARYLENSPTAVAEARDRTIEMRIVRPTGEVRHVWSIGRPVRNSTGEPERLVGVMFDVTDRKRAEEERMQVLSRITDGVEGVDADFRFTYLNDAGARILGKTAEEVMGKVMWDLFPEAVGTGFYSAYKIALEKQIQTDHEEYYEPLDAWIHSRVFPSPEGLSIYFQDVTESRRAEQAIRDLNENLEQKVAERTRELESVNRELESFSYSVSHDLRAPLRSIDGFSAAVIEDFGDSLDPEAVGYLNRVRQASQRMGLLIDDLLKLSRVSRAEMKRQEIDMSGLAERVFSLYKNNDPERFVKTVVAPGLIAHGDEVLVRAVLENLIGNAWKFTSKTDNARIEFGRETKSGQARFFVSDNGAGFDMNYRDKLFGAFQRLHPPKDFEGTGIGLATVQRIISRHGGRVDAEGDVGKGATFYFSLGRENGDSGI